MVKRKKNRKGLKEWGQALLLAFILALLIKGLVVQSFMVASPQMEKTILTGDFIMVNKIQYGARLPITLLSVPFFSSAYSELIQLPQIRMPGFGSIKHNDLIVFNYPVQFDPPIDKKENMVKRCIGLPGDTIKINSKKVFVNNIPNICTSSLQFNYRVVTNNKVIDNEFLEKYEINEGGMVSDIGIYDFTLDFERYKQIKADKNIRYIRELKDFPGENSRYIFPIGHYFSFNKDYFGPLVVPYKGQVIQLSTHNIEIYKILLTEYEGNSVEIKNYKIFINGKKTTKYTIKHDYYFVMDDNRDNAKDSRYWGFLPKSHIIGKASFIWFSYNKSKGAIRWRRMFKHLF